MTKGDHHQAIRNEKKETCMASIETGNCLNANSSRDDDAHT